MNIIKRNGDEMPFDKAKIVSAVTKANKTVKAEEQLTKEKIETIAEAIEHFAVSQEKPLSVEDIQNMVETKIQEAGAYHVAKHYIKYRYEREMARNEKALMEKLTASNVQNQNANVDEHSFGGRMGETLSLVAKKYALEHIVSKKSARNHNNNEIYIHDLDSYAVGMHNCFLRSTRFVTKEGIKSFEDFKDGEEVEVLTKDGTYSIATVHMYGRQPMQEVTFTRCGISLTKVCTKDHRWILSNGEVTTDIRVGDKIAILPENERHVPSTKRDMEMFALGFVLGDGCDHYGYLNIRLCGKKQKYVGAFKSVGYSVAQEFEDGVTLIKKAPISKQDFLTHKVWRILPPRDKEMLFEGYYAADGYQTTASYHIATADERLVLMAEEISTCAGFHVSYKRHSIRTTNYKADAQLWLLTLSRTQRFNNLWKVSKIEKGKHTNKDYEAWCISEPITNSFVLEGGIVTGNCLSIPFDKLLAEGFNTRQCDVRPAGSINTAMQLVAVIFQLQSLQQFGGVSATHLDWTMVPYVRLTFWKHYWDGALYIDKCPESVVKSKKEIRELSIDDDFYVKDCEAYKYAMDKTVQELEQAVEGMYHNLNTLQSRSGCQLPFTSINYGTCTLPEGRMVIKALIEGSIKGVGKFHKTPIFPCGIFQCLKGVNRKLGDPNYDLFKLALKSTALRLYPNYANVDWSSNAGFDRENPCTYFSTMGCRTANLADINADDPKLLQLKDGRGNICPVTCILPTYAMKAKKKADAEAAKEKKNGIEWDDAQKEKRRIEIFFEILDKKIVEAKDMLLERFEWICSQSPKSARFMYENGTMYGYKPEEGIRSALKHGTLAIGQLGMAETLQLLIGCDHTTAKGMKLAKKIEQLFKDKCSSFKQEYRLNFGVYYTPAENLCYTAMKKFHAKFGEIPNVSDRDYFTNSIHVPVWHKMTPFEKIDIESQLTGYSSAGCITYVEMDSSTQNNIEALEEVVNYAMDKDIPYFAINVPNDSCDDCGFTGDIGEKCPRCGSTKIQRLRRVTGYLTGDFKTAFNLGKQAETIDRAKHVGVEA